MTAPTPAAIAHRIASKAATDYVKAAHAAGLSWTDIAIGGETIISIVVSTIAEMNDHIDPARFAQEMVETMTERAHGRVQALIRGIPYDG